MKKDFREYFYNKYNSEHGSSAFKGSSVPDYIEYRNGKFNLVYNRNKVAFLQARESMAAKERSFFSGYIDPDRANTAIIRESDPIAVNALNQYVKAIINLKGVNDLRDINSFFREVNHKLAVYGSFGCCVDSMAAQKKRIYTKLPPIVSHLYYAFFFICNRLLPKLPLIEKVNIWIMGDPMRVISKTEVMGRLYAHGFKIADQKTINGKFYFIVHKIKKPVINRIPGHGMLVKMLRKGKNGKLIYVYKLRTMDAYSEYLQEYVYKENNLDKGGKFKDDFRVSASGKFLRRYWIDELPMLINILKGDIKLVGVRPLSAHYLSLYSGSLRKKRSNHKPGLLPPFYADMPQTIEEIMASEMRYLHLYERNPFLTDLVYLFRILNNILIKGSRSK